MFVVAMIVLYAALAAYDRTSPGGTSPGASTGFLWFTLLAVAITVAGAVVALGVAPRAVELRPDATIVHGRFGRRRTFVRDESYGVRVVRHFLSGPVQTDAADSVEIRSGGVRRTYLVEPDLVPTSGSGAG